MRLALAAVLLLGLQHPAAASDGEDDPKMSRVAPVEAFVLPDADDPKLARGAAPARTPWWRPRHHVPRFKLSFRWLELAGLEGGRQPFDAAELDFYPASGLIRFGIDSEFGWAGGKYGLWYVVTGATLGLQWPARVTPFVEGRFVAGLIGGSFMGQTAVSWTYQGGIETGVEIYYASRFYVSAAIGWARPVFGGVDVAQLNENQTIVRKDFQSDTFTFKVGLGL
jgi:hypothetical protein